jgi:hypothetical protein
MKMLENFELSMQAKRFESKLHMSMLTYLNEIDPSREKRMAIYNGARNIVDGLSEIFSMLQKKKGDVIAHVAVSMMLDELVPCEGNVFPQRVLRRNRNNRKPA